MKILMVSPEVAPYAKVGGLADMVAALSKALVKLGHEVRIICPKYGGWDLSRDYKAYPEPMIVNLGYGRVEFCQLWETNFEDSGVKLNLIEYNKYFARNEIYTGPWGSHADNNERFTFLSRAALDLCYYLNWVPDVIHCNDWTTGLIPVYLNTIEWRKPLGNVASVFSIHNLMHQGIFGPEVLGFAGIPSHVLREDCLEALGNVNMMKGGIYNATKLTTVSPNYAREIQTAEYGCGLDPVIKFRASDLVGIVNGIDTDIWNPETDKLIEANFSKDDLSGKAICKKDLQELFHLEVNDSIPVMGVISRLVDQKGLDLLLNIIPWIMHEMHIQIVILGTGESFLENGFNQMAALYPGRVGVYIGYKESLAHKIEAGSDFFIMPSRFEPCGLNQLYSMQYGTLPIARATGGLVDTIAQYQEDKDEGTGFLFQHPTPEALYYTIGWACATYYDRKSAYKKLQHNAMSHECSWDKSAKHYSETYEWAVEARSKRFG